MLDQGYGRGPQFRMHVVMDDTRKAFVKILETLKWHIMYLDDQKYLTFGDWYRGSYMNQVLVNWRTCELLDYHIVDALGQKMNTCIRM